MLSNFVNGIEVLLKKASVDAEFCDRLKNDREAAANLIGLRLTETETNILRSIPMDQLEILIRQTTIPKEQHGIFLGNDATVMLAMTSEETSWANYSQIRCGGGVRPDLDNET